MTRAIIWKELREQGTVMIALVVMGCGLLIAISVMMDQTDGRATDIRSWMLGSRLGLVLLLMTAGVVSGGTLFAGEREAGTLAYLDRLPGSRFRIWWRKIFAGVALMAVSGSILFAAAYFLNLLGSRGQPLVWAILTAAVTFAAFGWGTLGSTFARSSLAACGIAALLGLVSGFVIMPVFMAILGGARRLTREYDYVDAVEEMSVLELAFLVTAGMLIAMPLPLSAWFFTAPDRSRYLAETPVGAAGVGGLVRSRMRSYLPTRWSLGFRRLLWLSIRQLRVPALIFGGIGLLAGFAMLPEESIPSLVWPALSLVVGVLCGVIGMSDEQGSLSSRFWGERRLPVGRIWLAKVMAGGTFTLLVLLLMLLPLIVAAAVGEGRKGVFFATVFRTGLFEEEGFPIISYLLVWPVYGFAAGHLFALLFRKSLVAGAAGLMVAGTLAALWLPSMLSGGLHLWQPFLPALVLMLAARLTTWPWATDRIGTSRSLMRLSFILAAVLLVAAGGIAVRVLEVDPVAEIEDDIRFAAQIPTFDEKQPGRDLRRAMSQFVGENDAKVLSAIPDRPLFPKPRRDELPAHFREPSYLDEVPDVLEMGWPTDRPDLDAWADAMFASGWDEHIHAAAKKPTGVFEDPNEMFNYSILKNIDTMRRAGPLFLARGLQKQARGDPAAFVETLDAWLAAVRTMRNKSILISSLIGRNFEQMGHRALDRWLERLDGRPDLLRRALQVALDHEAKATFDVNSIRLAHQVVVRHSIDAPSLWLPRYLDDVRPGGSHRSSGLASSASLASETETNLIGFAWTVPWEKERIRRVVGKGNVDGGQRDETELFSGMPGAGALQQYIFPFLRGNRLDEGERFLVATRRAAICNLAVRLAEAETSRMPASLDELVPKYLANVPIDPFDKQPFRYRLSIGEVIEFDRDHGAALPRQNLPPGRVPETLSARITAVAGVAGGGICWPLIPGWMGPPPPPPGIEPPLAKDQIDAVAAAAGNLVLWPGGFWLEGLEGPWVTDVAPPPGGLGFSAGGPAIGVPLPGPPGEWPWSLGEAGLEPVAIPAGQAIVWSVGPDQSDNRATIATGPTERYGQNTGDLVYVVPRRPMKR